MPPDLFDHAQELEQYQRDAALSAQLARAPTGHGTADCVSCGEPIPVARKRANPAATRCTGCQTAADRTSLRSVLP